MAWKFVNYSIDTHLVRRDASTAVSTSSCKVSLFFALLHAFRWIGSSVASKGLILL